MLRASIVRASAVVLFVMVSRPGGALGQHRFLHPGDRVRVSWFTPESASRQWVYGTTHEATSRLFAVIPDGEQDASVMVLNEFSRVEVLSGRRSPTVLGAALGLGLGATAGATVLSDVMGSRQVAGGTGAARSAAVFGLIGGLVGGLIARQVGGDRWEDVPLADGRLVFPPFSDPTVLAGSAPLNRGQRWRRFDATVENFAAFFAEYRDSLHLIEGVWHEVGGPSQVAIVRDARFDGFGYVFVNLFVPRNSIERPGRIVGAARVGDAPGNFDIYALGVATLPESARLRGRDLFVDSRGGTGVTWTKLHP